MMNHVADTPNAMLGPTRQALSVDRVQNLLEMNQWAATPAFLSERS